MSPIKEHKKIKLNYLLIFYIVIFFICAVVVGMAVYNQFYKDEELPFIHNQSKEDTIDEDKYNEQKASFPSIFTNQLKKLQEDIDVLKIANNYDIVVTAFSYNRSDENIKLNALIPYFNIKSQILIDINSKISQKYRVKAEEIKNTNLSQSMIYNISYISYLQNDILSLAIRSELKVGTNKQKIEIHTYNYNIKEDREVSLQELLQLKGITIDEANNKIKDDIKKVQEQNNVWKQVLEDEEDIYERDYSSDIYNIENVEEFFLGNDGILYIIYAYGNKEDTSEMDIIIL